MTEQKIVIPSNMELVKVSDTEYKIVEKKRELPKSWCEFQKNYPIEKCECLITSDSEIRTNIESKILGHPRPNYYRNLLPNKEYAEAILALCQLIQLRDCYRQGWKPDYKDHNSRKHCINFFKDEIKSDFTHHLQSILTFQTGELRSKFYNNFKDLIEKTKPLFM